MTMTFKWKNKDEMMMVEDVKCFETSVTVWDNRIRSSLQ